MCLSLIAVASGLLKTTPSTEQNDCQACSQLRAFVQTTSRIDTRASMDPYIDAARTFDPTNPTHWLG